MEQVVEELKALRLEMENLKKANADRNAAMAMDEEQEGPSDAEDPSWGRILMPTTVEPTQPSAQFLCQVLSSPPPIDKLKASEKVMPCYANIPLTPPPRKNRIDTQLYTGQKKLEHAMHMITHHLETGDQEAIGIGAAWIRSAWEDMHQQRRTLMAGKQAFKLDPRADDTRPRLLTKEEEQKIQRQRRPKPRARPFWGEAQSSNFRPTEAPHYRSKTPTTPRGKGKGKGKGKTM